MTAITRRDLLAPAAAPRAARRTASTSAEIVDPRLVYLEVTIARAEAAVAAEDHAWSLCAPEGNIAFPSPAELAIRDAFMAPWRSAREASLEAMAAASDAIHLDQPRNPADLVLRLRLVEFWRRQWQCHRQAEHAVRELVRALRIIRSLTPLRQPPRRLACVADFVEVVGRDTLAARLGVTPAEIWRWERTDRFPAEFVDRVEVECYSIDLGSTPTFSECLGRRDPDA